MFPLLPDVKARAMPPRYIGGGTQSISPALIEILGICGENVEFQGVGVSTREKPVVRPALDQAQSKSLRSFGRGADWNGVNPDG